MKTQICISRCFGLFLTMMTFFSFTVVQAKELVKVLILTGQNNHNWQDSHLILQKYLTDSGLFAVDLAISPEAGGDMSAFCPKFADYQAVVLDYNGDAWSDATNKAFLDYVEKGGGVVVYHAADNAFRNWKEYNEIIGLGGWESRNETDGPYVYFKDGKEVRDNTPGPGGSHGNQHNYVLKLRDKKHPIVKGLPDEWTHCQDELYDRMRGPAKNMTVLATAFSDKSEGGTGRDEPLLMVIHWGKGRIFHTMLGHVGKEATHPAVECTDFVVTFLRGTEWAATGKVTQKVPSNFSQSSGNNVYTKLFAELDKYAVVYDKYDDANYPILSGNAAMGGLMDPLGRGVYNIEVNDLYLNEKERCFGPGMMLNVAQFAGLQPEEYRQSYDLGNGILSTHIAYSTGAYNSELFFSQDDKELMVYTLTNLGKDDLLCNIDLGRYSLKFAGQSSSSLYLTSPDGSFSCLHYFLQSNMNLNAHVNAHLPYSQDVYVNVPPGETVELTLRLNVRSDNMPQAVANPTDRTFLLKNHINKWQENWKSMGFVILPEGEYAKTFYRSLHWLQCTAGLERNLPGEQQFATLTSNMAAAYNYHGKVRLNHSPWWQEPFTYGGAGWSMLAYTWFGDKTRAGNMLAGLYRPEVLKKNVTDMFPVGKYEFEYGGKKKGNFEYLSADNGDAIAFAHENLFDRSNHQVPPWDKQVHIQGFAPAMYYHYSRLYAEKEDTAYAVMRGSARFWQSILHWDAKQKSYTMAPLLSLTEDLFEADLLDALIAAKWVLTQAAVLAEQRNTDGDLRKQWLQIAQNIRIKDRNGVYLEFGGDDGSRAGAGYMGIRGYTYLGFPTLETMKSFAAKKVNKSLDLCWERNKKGEGMITFIANWFALTDAYWGRAEEAYEKSSYCLTQTDPSSSAMCEQNGALYYFLTGYASFTMVPVSMVLQSVGNEIKVFPAVPKAFADIEFYNLPAATGIQVSGVMKGGKTQRVWFEKDGKQLLAVNDKEAVSVTFIGDKLVLK